MRPLQMAPRPSQRDALAATNGRQPGIERTNALAQLSALALLAAVVFTIALRNC